MKLFNKTFLTLCLSFVLMSINETQAQNNKIEVTGIVGPKDTIITYSTIFQGDTIPSWYWEEVKIVDQYLSRDMANKMARLKSNVLLVYPYALEASKILNELDIELKKADKKSDRKKYLKSVEEQLNAKFKDRLKNLSTTQGAILVKLINRQTGRDVYSIIKELKGGLNARLSQTAFYFFDNNLKAQYDPYKEDKDIETIVREIESKAYYNIQLQSMELLKMNSIKK